MAAKNIVIFLASVRPNRMAERVGKFVQRKVEAAGMKTTLFDPQEMMFEVVQLPVHFMPNPEEAPNWLKEAHSQIKAADGFIIISAEYNSTLPPALTNMIDHFPPSSYRHRPCGIVSYSPGQFGGVRALIQLPMYGNELGMLILPTKVPIPTVQNAIEADGTCLEERVDKNISTMVAELDWYSNAFSSQKKIAPPPS